MISFANEAQLLVEEYWDTDDFTRMFPPVAFPAQISMYLLTMAGRVRQKMTDNGIGEHKSMWATKKKRKGCWKMCPSWKVNEEKKSSEEKSKKKKGGGGKSKYVAAGAAAVSSLTATAWKKVRINTINNTNNQQQEE